ncbi:hypothetical protein NPIL_478971 [Nephila pilipes]|uniref:Uncharacterized protein n=1 Tax=Nephila pilipes TaxID=299642 RepID=A0A8X6Q5A0_NEPPI|nr:hypothetical protein NPIL_478971 [Nephila pilipes]
MKGKAPADILHRIPGHTIPDLKIHGPTILDLKRPDHTIPHLNRPYHAIPDLKRPDYGVSKSTLVAYPLLGDVSFLRFGKNPVPKFPPPTRDGGL